MSPAPEPLKGPYPRVTSSDYAHTVQRVQEIVSTSVPADSIVLVASKGDEGLLALENRDGWHFPQTQEGEYAGHYPEDGASVISHLEELRSRGARYLAFPSTALWWLDYYGELREHLQENGRLVAEDKECVVFELSGDDPPAGTPSSAPPAVQPAERSRPAAHRADGSRPLREVARGLLPAEAGAALLGSDPATMRALELEGYRVQGIGGGDPGALVSTLREAERLGCRFLLVTRDGFETLDSATELKDHVRREYSFVTRQEEVCEIYERREQSANATGSSGSRAAGAGQPRLLARLRALLPGSRRRSTNHPGA